MSNDFKKLNTVKFNIRSVLEEKGVDIDADTPFEQYPELIRGASGGGNLPEISYTNRSVLEEQTITFEEEDGLEVEGFGAATIDVKLDNVPYVVTFDGVEYRVEPQSTEGVPQGMSIIIFGNMGLVGSDAPDTGEPFVIEYLEQGEVSIGYIIGTLGDHTVGISIKSSNPPEGTVLSVKEGEWVASGRAVPDVVTPPNAVICEETEVTLINMAESGDPIYGVEIPNPSFSLDPTIVSAYYKTLCLIWKP